MPTSNPLGDWSALVDHLDTAGYPQRWSTDPDLHGLSSIQQLQDWTAPGDPQRADRVLGALVRLAAADGAAERHAAMVLMHLLLPGARRLASKLRHLSPDPVALVIGELAIQIHRFPVGRRTHAHAANLLLDTQHAMRRESKPYRNDRPDRPAELLVDPIDDADVTRSDIGGGRWARSTQDRTGRWERGLLDDVQPGPDRDELDLVDMLLWARRTGAVDPDDLAVLVELEYARETPGLSPQKHVADAHGWTVRTVQRRRDRALASLRACSAAYLAAA